MSNKVSIKPLKAEYEAFMWELLYNNIFVARDNQLADRDIDELPALKKYIENWGESPDDIGFIALDQNNQPVGAIWTRLFQAKDQMWGYVDDKTPELNIAVVERIRNNGVGSKMLKKMFKALQSKYQRVSLSVHPSNRSISLYKRHGFTVYETFENALTMVKTLS